MKIKYYVNLVFFVFFSPIFIFSQENTPKYPPITYVSLVKDIGSYYLYANGGFNADWYIGYNNCWIVKLPPVKKDNAEKAYIGVKIGRAKSNSDGVVPGKIYVAISENPSFTSDSGYFIADSAEIPKEPLANDSIEGIDSSKWFWAKVPLSRISFEKDNYVVVWSQSSEFVSSAQSPIIAAAASSDGMENVWLNRSVKGAPPYGKNTLETPISGIKPAIVIKLLPLNDYKVIIKNFTAEVEKDRIIVNFSVVAADARRAWLEISYDKFEWQKIGGYIYSPPYFMTLFKKDLPKDMFYLRVAASDNYENIGYSKEIIIPAEKKENILPKEQELQEEK